MSEAVSDNLTLEINGQAKQALEALDALATRVRLLSKTASNASGLSKFAGQLAVFKKEIRQLPPLKNVELFSNRLRQLMTLPKTTLTNSFAKNFNLTLDSIDRITPEHASKLDVMVKSLKGIAGIPTLRKEKIDGLARLPDVFKSFNQIKISDIANHILKLAMTMRPLAVEMEKISMGFSALPSKIQRFIHSMDGGAKSVTKFQNPVRKLAGWIVDIKTKLIAFSAIFHRFIGSISKYVSLANEYVENMNLFTVAMGENAEAANTYADIVQSKLGIDKSEWVRNQGFFQNIASGFGVASDKASIMSKNLTEVAYDMASFLNLPIDEAVQKVQSGIAGELEPLRRVGYALDEATLKHIALSYGIETNIRDMTQAEKAQLRYIAIIQQSKNAMGDLSRTIHTPANAMRIFGQEVLQLKRAIGNVLTPVLMSVLPYLKAMVQLLIEGASWLAALLGFEMPTINYSSMEQAVPVMGDVADAAEDMMAPINDVANNFDKAGTAATNATNAAKEFKNYLLGFDEMHIIPSDGETPYDRGRSPGGGKLTGGSTDGFDIKLPEHSGFLVGLEEKVNNIKEKLRDLFDKIKPWVRTAWEFIKGLGIALTVKKLFDNVGKLFTSIDRFKDSKGLKAIGNLVGGGTLAALGGFFTGKAFGKGDIGGLEALAGGLGTAATSSVMLYKGLTTLGITKAGWIGGVIGVAVTALAAVIGYFKGVEEAARKADLDKRFGDMKASLEDIQNMVKAVTNDDLSIKVRLYATQADAAQAAKDAYERTEMEFRTMLFKLQIGIDIDAEKVREKADTMMSQLQTYLDETHTRVKMALEFSFGADVLRGTKEGKTLMDSVNGQFESMNTEFLEIQQQLSDALTMGFENGWKDVNVQNALNEAISKLEQFKHGIEEWEKNNAVDKASAKLSFADIYDADSVNKYMEEFKAAKDELRIFYQDQVIDAEIALQNAKLDPNIYQRLHEYLAEKSQGIELQMSIDVGTEFKAKIGTEYEEEIKGHIDYLRDFSFRKFDEMTNGLDVNVQSILNSVTEDWGNASNSAYQIVQNTIIGVNENIVNTTNDLWKNNKVAADNYRAQWKASVENVAKDSKSIAKDMYAAGYALTDEYRKGMYEVMESGYLARDLDSISYLTGYKLSVDNPEFAQVLSQAKNAAKMIPHEYRLGFLSNVSYVYDEADQMFLKLGNQIVTFSPELVENMRELGFNIPEALITELQKAKEPVGNTYREYHGVLDEQLKSATDATIEKANEAANNISNQLPDTFRAKSSELEQATADYAAAGTRGIDMGVAGLSETAKNGTSAAADNVTQTLNEKTPEVAKAASDMAKATDPTQTTEFKEVTENARRGGSEMGSQLSAGFTSQSGAIYEAIVNTTAQMNVAFSDGFNNISETTNTWLSGMGQSISSFNAQPNLAGRMGSYNYRRAPKMVGYQYATGGMPDSGELYMANENGVSEYIGRFGSRAAVANNDQIVDGISKGVYQAMMNARSDEGDGDYIIIQVDGNTVNQGYIRDFKRTNKRAGRVLIPVGE